MVARTQSPALGTAYLDSIEVPKGVDHLTPSTCLNFSRFQRPSFNSGLYAYCISSFLSELLRQSRALDDRIMNRRIPSNYGAANDPECATVWADLVNNWQGREKIVRYCIAATEHQPAPATNSSSSAALADERAAALAEEEPLSRRVVNQQIRNELAVETITRRRIMAEFLRRCIDFTPPKGTVPSEDLAHLPAPTRERLV